MMISNQPLIAVLLYIVLVLFSLVDCQIVINEDTEYQTHYDHISIMFIVILMVTGMWDEKIPEEKGTRGLLIKRKRRRISTIFYELGKINSRRAYRMHPPTFWKLHEMLYKFLIVARQGKRKRGVTPNGDISTSIRLSIALRYFTIIIIISYYKVEILIAYINDDANNNCYRYRCCCCRKKIVSNWVELCRILVEDGTRWGGGMLYIELYMRICTTSGVRFQSVIPFLLSSTISHLRGIDPLKHEIAPPTTLWGYESTKVRSYFRFFGRALSTLRSLPLRIRKSPRYLADPYQLSLVLA
jgi:hypothetical protein